MKTTQNSCLQCPLHILCRVGGIFASQPQPAIQAAACDPGEGVLLMRDFSSCSTKLDLPFPNSTWHNA
jgi:hypothetical protein